MKHPLAWRYRLLRETTCFFLGHKWHGSPICKTQYYGADVKDVPYNLRKSSGNYMWEYVAWWSAKCTRCRDKVRQPAEAHHVWYKNQYWAIRAAIYKFSWHLSDEFECTGSGNPISWHLKPLQFLMACVSALLQYLMQFETLPWTWWTWLADIEYWWYGKLEGE